MDFIWTIALLVIGYFAYNWYTGLQQQVKNDRKPDNRLEEDSDEGLPDALPAAKRETDYIDFEEVKDQD